MGRIDIWPWRRQEFLSRLRFGRAAAVSEAQKPGDVATVSLALPPYLCAAFHKSLETCSCGLNPSARLMFMRRADDGFIRDARRPCWKRELQADEGAVVGVWHSGKVRSEEAISAGRAKGTLGRIGSRRGWMTWRGVLVRSPERWKQLRRANAPSRSGIADASSSWHGRRQHEYAAYRHERSAARDR